MNPFLYGCEQGLRIVTLLPMSFLLEVLGWFAVCVFVLWAFALVLTWCDLKDDNRRDGNE